MTSTTNAKRRRTATAGPGVFVPDRTAIVLARPWNDTPSGARFEVLASGQDPRPGAVDARRAATLVESGFAEYANRPAGPGDEQPNAIDAFHDAAAGEEV